MVAFCHSAVLPSGASKRARGTRTVTGPKVPISPRWRWPCRASPHNRPAAYAGLGKPRPFIPVPPQRNVEFRFQEFLDEAANAGPHPGFQGIEPIVPKEKCSFGRVRRRFCGIRFHGVISIGATTPIRLVETTRRLRHLQIPTTPATAPPDTVGFSLPESLRHEQDQLCQ